MTKHRTLWRTGRFLGYRSSELETINEVVRI